MASLAPKRMTLAEFLEWDEGTDRRYELLDGTPVMMAPTLEAHGELAVALGAEIRARLKQPCRVISEAGIVIRDRADTCRRSRRSWSSSAMSAGLRCSGERPTAGGSRT